MNKTLENAFFEPFKFGGIVDNCIDYIQKKYDLGINPKSYDNLSPQWEKYYKELPIKIIEKTEAFDKSIITGFKSPLIDEIEKNLIICDSPKEKKNYLFSLLISFKRFSDIFKPVATINSLKKDIEKAKQDLKYWESVPKDTILKPSGTPKEQIEACKMVIEQRKKDIERTDYISSQFVKIINETVDKNTVEWCLCVYAFAVSQYANRLDALLVTYGIDLLELQKECGIYLKYSRNITDIELYIGTTQLAQKYINELPKKKEPVNTNTLPPEPQANKPTNEVLKQPHFDGDFNDKELTEAFEKLKQGRYIHSESDLNSFIYVCTGRNEFTKPINWMETAGLLGMFVNDLFITTNKTNIWELAFKCFTIKNKPPKISTIKTIVSKITQNWREQPKRYPEMKETIINELI